MYNHFDRRAKTAPSQYPRVPFHALRFIQLLSSLIVGGIMSFFMWHLTHDNWPTPWTFILLMASSLFSVAALKITIVLHCCVGLKPDLNIAINGFLSLLWVVSWSLLTWYMSPTLSHMCDVENWHEDTGIFVCRVYKTLFTFAFFGVVSTLAALCLDFYVRRQNNRRGIYRLHDLGDPKGRPEATKGPFTDEGAGYASQSIDEPRESEAWESPRPSTGPYSESKPKVWGSDGYSVPAGQFGYEDTGYHGGQLDRP